MSSVNQLVHSDEDQDEVQCEKIFGAVLENVPTIPISPLEKSRNFYRSTSKRQDLGSFKLVDEKSSGTRGQQDVQDFYKLRQQCLDSGVLFEDREFDAIDSSLMFSRPPKRHYKWLRPKEICEKPQFFVDGHQRFDVQQGELGDCWLLAAAANLTQDSKLFFRVVCEDNTFEENYAGIFHFKFWQYGKWVDVVVDDRLPTYRGELIYMRSTEKNEFWSALLEKAYAKLHGAYEALRGGTTSEALEDFTGGVTEKFELKKAPSNLFNIMHKAFDRQSMMGCSIEADPNVTEAVTPQGLIRGHAYSITKVSMVDITTPRVSGKIPLLRLRNPWGNEAEWNGAWSDKSREWSLIPENAKKEIGLSFEHDGEFWISYPDFLKYFDHVEICNLSPYSMSGQQKSGAKKKWNMNVFEGEWVAGTSAGGCRNYLDSFHRNPQYVMTLEEPDKDDEDGKCTVVVSLMQKNRRSKRKMGIESLFIGFAVYRLTDRDLATKPQQTNFFKNNRSAVNSPNFINLREVSCRFELPPGHYLIVPSTFEPNEEGEFLIRVFTESSNTFEENEETVGIGSVDRRIVGDLPDVSEGDAIEKLFMEIAGPKEEIRWEGLKRILDHSMRDETDQQGLSKEICRSMVAMFDFDYSGKINLEEVKNLMDDIAKWKAVFKLYDQDRTNKLNAYELRGALASSGYHLNNHILNSLVHRYGSADRTIAFDDFIMCAVKVKMMIKHFNEKDFKKSNQVTFTRDEWITRVLYA